ncbi:MAG: hypothetical protein IPM29_04435 [Planctomycetes bacterium]|nr:hypothetical protein [Planctomycetota bacterium]
MSLLIAVSLVLPAYRWSGGGSGDVLLWLRKFERRDPGADLAREVLLSACAHLVTPVTLQDPRVPGSRILGFAGLSALFVPLFLLFAMGLGGLSELTSAVRGRIPVWAGFALILSSVAVLSAVGLWLVPRWLYRRLSHVRTGSAAEVEARLARLSRWRLLSGVLVVLRVPADVWPAAVRSCLDAARLVVLDTSFPTDNLEAELEWALSRVGPKRILLMHGVAAMGDHPLAADALAALRRRLPRIAGLRVVLYLADVRPNAVTGGRYRQFLRNQLLSFIAAGATARQGRAPARGDM